MATTTLTASSLLFRRVQAGTTIVSNSVGSGTLGLHCIIMYYNSCFPHTPLMHCARWNPHKTMMKVYVLYNLIHDKLQIFTSDTCIMNTWSREYADVPLCMHLSLYAPFAPRALSFSLLCACSLLYFKAVKCDGLSATHICHTHPSPFDLCAANYASNLHPIYLTEHRSISRAYT